MSTNGDTKHDPNSTKFNHPQIAEIQTSHNNNANDNLNHSNRSNDDNSNDSFNVNSLRKEESPKEGTISTIRKDDGKRTVTMRELLTELKNVDSNQSSPSSIVSTPPRRSELFFIYFFLCMNH